MSEDTTTALPRPVLGSARARDLQERAHRAIPGGAHTYAKGDDQYPELAPTLLVRGQGCRVWDVDGNEFVEYGMGLRAVGLGHAFPRVVEAVKRQVELGTNFTRPAAIEVECAELLLSLVPGAEMAKFTKDGSTATTAAVRLARAHTGRDVVALCRDHPFFSYDDWAIGTTPMRAGIPERLADLTATFPYGDLAAVEAIFAERPGEVACVILEPERDTPAPEGYLEGLQALCAREGAVFVLDETITGFRYHQGGVQTQRGIVPDLSIFGKALANGFAVSALLGRRELMELGGIRHDRDRVFLLSTTHGAETHSLAAAIATMETYRDEPVIPTMEAQGSRLAEGVRRAAAEAGVEQWFGVAGRPQNLYYVTRDPEGKPSQPFRTLFLQEVVARGFLMPSLVNSYSHRDVDTDLTVEAIAEALLVYRKAIEEGVERHLAGRSVKPVFRARC